MFALLLPLLLLMQDKPGNYLWVKWQAGSAVLTLQFKAAPGTEVIKGVAPGRNPADKVPMIIVRRKALRTIFEVRHEIK